MYKIIDDLPIDFDFHNKTKDELKLYFEWFFKHKEARLEELFSLIKLAEGYENWNADYSKGSFYTLGEWLEENVTIEKLTKEEYDKKRTLTPAYIEIEDWDLTLKTRSVLFDMGIYFGEVFIKNNQGLKWVQFFTKRKQHIDQGHIIIPLKKDNLNPIWVMLVIGFKFAKKTANKNILKETYEMWEKYR